MEIGRTDRWHSKEIYTIHQGHILIRIIGTSELANLCASSCHFLLPNVEYATTANVQQFIGEEETFVCWSTTGAYGENFIKF